MASEGGLMGLPVSQILLVTGFFLVLIGLGGILAHRNILRIIIGFSLVDTGIHVVMVATGYVTGGTAPIIDAALEKADAAANAVDPIPSALVVTAIVIGFSVTAIMLSFAIRLYDAKETLDIDAFTESKW
jgi:multisubunit Na+/H+ antiporter MnhC subunit